MLIVVVILFIIIFVLLADKANNNTSTDESYRKNESSLENIHFNINLSVYTPSEETKECAKCCREKLRVENCLVPCYEYLFITFYR